MDGQRTANPVDQGTGASYTAAKDLPWVPWELAEGLKYRLLKVDPVHGTFCVVLYAPENTGLGKHHHTGFVQVYTEQGRWKYNEHDWIADPGSLVYETSDSRHSFFTLPGDDVIAYIHMNGTLEFLDENDSVVHIENWRTFLDRQNAYFDSIGHVGPDVTAFESN